MALPSPQDNIIRIFIGSSSKSEKYARALKAVLEKTPIDVGKIEAGVWLHAFEPSGITLDELLAEANRADFAAFVFAKDDLVFPGGEKLAEGHSKFVTRDNVVFELGLFMGQLGRDRVFFTIPEESSDLHLPSDLSGVVWTKYSTSRADRNAEQSMDAVALRIQNRINSFQSDPPSKSLVQTLSELTNAVSQFRDHAQTRPIGVFPDFYEAHTCRLIKQPGPLWIASDVLCYGAFTIPEVSEQYMAILTDRQDPVNVVIPAPEQKVEHVSRQIPPGEWQHRYGNDPQFKKKVQAFSRKTDIYPIATPAEFYESMHSHEARQREILEGTRKSAGLSVDIHEKPMSLPLYLWIRGDVEAIFSIPIDRASDVTSQFEHAFYTRDRDLVGALRATWERYCQRT